MNESNTQDVTARMRLAERLAAAKTTLDKINQGHVLHFYETLADAGKDKLLKEIEAIDWQEVDRLIKSHVRQQPQLHIPEHIDPAPWYPSELSDTGGKHKDKYKKAKKIGVDLIRKGKVAAFTVAGGQGTRLGWNQPKGTYPATPIRKLPLFAVFAEYIRKAQEKYDCTIPWYVMTSPQNDAATRAFFEEHGYFGLDAGDVLIFPQAMMPAMDMQSGKVLLQAADGLALSPNGHGGSLKALYTSGAIADMHVRGVEQISYIQIDNPNVHVIDPLFIGLHAMDKAQMSSKMVPKAYPKEKLGNFCSVDGRITVIEYSDLPDELAQQRVTGEDGREGDLRFKAGSIAIHIIAVDFVEQLNESEQGFGLPFHRAEKVVSFIDLDSAQPILPKEPNAVKLETFVFDALPLCEQSIIYETDRIEEFAPIKNAEGVDSPETSVQLQTERAARWLAAQGVKIAKTGDGKTDAVIEICPLTAIAPEDLEDIELPKEIAAGTEVLL